LRLLTQFLKHVFAFLQGGFRVVVSNEEVFLLYATPRGAVCWSKLYQHFSSIAPTLVLLRWSAGKRKIN